MTKIYAQDRGERAFHDWHQNSAVRSRPYAYLLTPQDLADTDPERWYPTSLNPVLSLSEVTKLPSSTRLNAHVAHLVHFLDYTTTLELTVVNDAVASMTLGALKQNFDAVDQRAALKLYTDEGYHALFSRQIADQLVEHFDIARHPAMRLLLLNQYIEQTPSTYKSLAVFMIAFVSETIITRELLDLSREQLVEPVFHMLRDHLHDEARHSVFFSDCFCKLLPQLSRAEEAFVASALTDIIWMFCRPDRDFLKILFGSDQQNFSLILERLDSTVSTRIAWIAAPTIRAIQRTNLLKHKEHRNLFRTRGLLGKLRTSYSSSGNGRLGNAEKPDFRR